MEKLLRIATAFLAVTLLISNIPVQASSHREAPFITELPKVDSTDFYLFNSYESGRDGFVTILANYQPLQQSYGGPNFFTLDPEAVYEIHIDNNGDAKEDLTFQFQAMNKLNDIAVDVNGNMVSAPFVNVGQIGPGVGDNASSNIIETYSAKLIRGPRRTGKAEFLTNTSTGDKVFVKPTDNIGNKSIPNYDTYARNHIFNVNIPGCSEQGKVFVGQRTEGFVVDLGGTFDLVNFNPVGDPKAGRSEIADNNITTFALELPKSCIVGDTPVIGAWTTASLPRARVFSRVPSFDKSAIEKGPLVQISRLSAPLVNELVIGVKDKNKFNFSEPKKDAQFASYVVDSSLAAVIELLYSGIGYKAPTLTPRSDLVSVFLTGVEGLNQTPNTVKNAAEMLRLNTSIAAVAAAQQKPLAVLDGDNGGFPNGRRPGDDVVDIELRAVSGALIKDTAKAPAGGLAITDGAFIDATQFDQTFPYLKSPVPGKVTTP